MKTWNKPTDLVLRSLARIERTLYVLAACAALFGVWTDIVEADQRRLEVEVLRASLLGECLALIGPGGPISKAKLFPQVNEDYKWEVSEDTRNQFAAACAEIELREVRKSTGDI